ncbi:hypothetical protein JCM10213_004932 [Rhodosporidiobolus nylandii]
MISSYSSHSTTPYKPAPKQSTSAQPYEDDQASQRFVIGKIDAGIAVLISDSVHLIEFPSLLLPPGVGPGSIVNISCSRNISAEKAHARDFWDLQRDIFETFGAHEPSPPVLRVRNTTQTSVTLEWDKLDLASASLISLSMYRNGQRLTTIPNPLTNTSTKLSGLQLDTDYSFHLVLKTTAGTFSSPIVKTRTHTIDNTSGVRVCFGLVQPDELLQQAKDAVKQMGAEWSDKIQIDSTHFVATSSASKENPTGGASVEYQKAVQLSIPIVSPEWLLACSRSSKLVPISAYYISPTNHAASLSSANLVSSVPSPATSPRTPARQAPPRPPVVLEEPEAAPTPPPVQLEEDVEEPPRDEVVTPDAEQRDPEPETDASTKALKSEAEEAASSSPAAEEDKAEELEQKQDELSEKPRSPTPPTIVIDAPGDELAAEQDAAEDTQEEPAAAEPEAPAVEAPLEQEVELDAPATELKKELDAEAAEADKAEDPPRKSEDETNTPKASATFDEAEGEEKEGDDGKEEQKDGEDEGETSLVDISL